MFCYNNTIVQNLMSSKRPGIITRIQNNISYPKQFVLTVARFWQDKMAKLLIKYLIVYIQFCANLMLLNNNIED